MGDFVTELALEHSLMVPSESHADNLEQPKHATDLRESRGELFRVPPENFNLCREVHNVLERVLRVLIVRLYLR
jgi:hypothetical protein